MNIEINTKTTFEDIQKQFSSIYPYLKIESQDKSKAGDKGLHVCEICGADTGNCDLNINKELTIAEFEQELQRHWKQPVQVLRRSGSFWINTSLTKDWTLEHQNKEGELLSKEN